MLFTFIHRKTPKTTERKGGIPPIQSDSGHPRLERERWVKRKRFLPPVSPPPTEIHGSLTATRRVNYFDGAENLVPGLPLKVRERTLRLETSGISSPSSWSPWEEWGPMRKAPTLFTSLPSTPLKQGTRVG